MKRCYTVVFFIKSYHSTTVALNVNDGLSRVDKAHAQVVPVVSWGGPLRAHTCARYYVKPGRVWQPEQDGQAIPYFPT